VIPAFVSAALTDRPIPVHGDGRQTRDFTYVGTVVAVLADALARRVSSPSPVNLAFGSRRSLLEVIELLEQIIGRDLPVVHSAPRAGDVRDSQADAARLLRLFPAIEAVPLEQGLRETLDWFAAGAA
jgi:UDP-glucose 4-epimerase